jgi:hypothetical protein
LLYQDIYPNRIDATERRQFDYYHACGHNSSPIAVAGFDKIPKDGFDRSAAFAPILAAWRAW